MRILHVTHQYPPAIGGAERHIANISEELTRRGHQVDVFTTRSTDYQTWRGSLPRCEELGGVKVYRFECFKRGRLTWKVLRRGLGGYQRTRSAWYTPFIIWGNGPISPAMIWRLLRSGRQYDLIHVNSLHYAPVSYVYLVARCLGVPFAVTPFVHIDQPVVFDIEFQNAIIRNADLVLAMTDREKDYLCARGVPGDRVTVAGGGVRLEDYPQLDPKVCRQRLGLPQEGFLLLFLGRKEKYKGLESLLVAFERVQGECPDLFLVAAGGETDYSRQLRERFSGLDRIVFLNRVSEQVKLELLNACDLFALPSVGE
jgi:glycosyltransferase involved in cell wall biosynthesis